MIKELYYLFKSKSGGNMWIALGMVIAVFAIIISFFKLTWGFWENILGMTK